MTAAQSPIASIRDQVTSSLSAISRQTFEPFDASVAALVITTLGDALRIGATVPHSLFDQLSRVSEDQLGAAINHAIEGLKSSPISVASIQEAVGERDLAESFQIGLVRTCLARGSISEMLPGFVAFKLIRTELDELLDQQVTQQRAEQLLGQRRWLLTGSDWTRRLRSDSTDDVAEIDSTTALPLDASSSFEPTVTVVDSYIRLGIARKWVEDFAANNDDFRDRLRELIAALHEAEEDVSLLAWKWWRGTAPVPVAKRVTKRLAAASGDIRRTRRMIRLGRLDPISAEANLTIDDSDIVLNVFEQPGTIKRIEFGGTSTTNIGTDSTWTVRVASSQAAMLLRVEDVRGQTFETILQLSE